MKLDGLIGNEPLKRAVSGMERPPHAVVLSGAAGSGKHLVALRFAQALVCSGAGETPCLVCQDCRRVQEGIHPDVMGLERFTPEADREKDVRVSVIRDIRADAQIRPNQASCKVYLIDRPIRPEGQNAMLKLLEEGPPYAAFLLLTENSAALLETVRSRCAQFHTSPLSRRELLELLRERCPQQREEALAQAAESAEGIPGRALAALENREEADRAGAMAEKWLQALAVRSEWSLMQCAVEAQTGKLSRDSAEQLYAQLGERLREAMCCAAGLPGDYAPELRQLAAGWDSRQLMECWRCTVKAGEMCVSNVPAAHSAGWLAVRLYECAAKL